MAIKSSHHLNKCLKIKQADTKVKLESLRASKVSELKNIEELRVEMLQCYQVQSRYAKILGKQITLAEERVKKLDKLIFHFEREQHFQGKIIQNTNPMIGDKKVNRRYWLNYWPQALQLLTYTHDYALDQRMKNLKIDW